jgi:hypothetical protein
MLEENEAWDTTFDLCRVPIGGGKVKCLTSSNLAADGSPRFSPDGKLLAYRAQTRPGFEADRWQRMTAEPDGSSARRTYSPMTRSLCARSSWEGSARAAHASAKPQAGRAIERRRTRFLGSWRYRSFPRNV